MEVIFFNDFGQKIIDLLVNEIPNLPIISLDLYLKVIYLN